MPFGVGISTYKLRVSEQLSEVSHWKCICRPQYLYKTWELNVLNKDILKSKSTIK